jgi:hypothetical protein
MVDDNVPDEAAMFAKLIDNVWAYEDDASMWFNLEWRFWWLQVVWNDREQVVKVELPKNNSKQNARSLGKVQWQHGTMQCSEGPENNTAWQRYKIIDTGLHILVGDLSSTLMRWKVTICLVSNVVSTLVYSLV